MSVNFDGVDRRRDLDGLRGIAILLTISLHYVSRSGYFSYLGPPPVELFLDSFWSGVDIFFVLSGLLIGGIILDNGRAGNFFRVFYLRRALRILPVALLTIAFSYLVIPLLAAPIPVWRGEVPPYAYLLFINNFWTADGFSAYPPLGPMWSLSIEEQFYLIAPAFILLINTGARNLALLTIVVISPLLRMCDLGVSFWDFTLLRLDGFSAGILVAVLVRDARFSEFAARNRRMINIVVAGLAAITLMFSISLHNPRTQVALGISLNSLSAAGAVLFLHINRTSALSRMLSRQWLVATGRMSYFLYLMHLPILTCVIYVWGQGGLRQVVFAFAISLLAAWGSWRFLESPLINIGKKFPYQHPESINTHYPATAASARER